MPRATRSSLMAAIALTAAACAAATSFTSSWKAPDARPLNFKGRKVAALVVSKDIDIRMSAEGALARELTALGVEGLPAYTVIPKELIQDKDKAKEFLDRAGVVGVVAMRVVSKGEEVTAHGPTYWSAPYYSSFWGPGYYGWGWGAVYDPGYVQVDTVVAVETLVYSLEQDKLCWAGQSRTTNPKDVGPFIKALVGKVAAELKKQGLVRG